MPLLSLLKQLCAIRATAGNEGQLSKFLQQYVRNSMSKWENRPRIFTGDELQDNVILQFGQPRTAVFAHMDTVGFTVGYYNQLIPIGSPQVQSGDLLVGSDSMGRIEATIEISDEDNLSYLFPRAIDRGTDLVFPCKCEEQGEYIVCNYLDNRLGMAVLLKLAEELVDGLLIFSCREEHGGGAVPILLKHVYERYAIRQSLICDITWVTEGIKHGKGVAISLRDHGIPRKSYISRILKLADQSGVDYQLEVESTGSSDAREIQASPYPIDWCFIGAPESGVHSPREMVHQADIESMLNLYRYLMINL